MAYLFLLKFLECALWCIDRCRVTDTCYCCAPWSLDYLSHWKQSLPAPERETLFLPLEYENSNLTRVFQYFLSPYFAMCIIFRGAIKSCVVYLMEYFMAK